MKWAKQDWGWEAKGVSGASYVIEWVSSKDVIFAKGERQRWLLRVNGEVTDADSSSHYLKRLAATYENDARSPGKPLIEILS